VAVTLGIGALANVSFVIGSFKFNLTLLEVFYLKDIFVVGAGLRSTKNMERWSLVRRRLMLKIFVTVCPCFSISDCISDGFMEKCMVLRTTL
jgi:hypothetical protein